MTNKDFSKTHDALGSLRVELGRAAVRPSLYLVTLGMNIQVCLGEPGTFVHEKQSLTEQGNFSPACL